jgi:hypothetical protein
MPRPNRESGEQVHDYPNIMPQRGGLNQLEASAESRLRFVGRSISHGSWACKQPAVVLLSWGQKSARMATLTIRKVSLRVVASLKSLAERNHRSVEQEVLEMVERRVGDRLSAMDQIRRSWENQKRLPAAREIKAWIRQGRHR